MTWRSRIAWPSRQALYEFMDNSYPSLGRTARREETTRRCAAGRHAQDARRVQGQVRGGAEAESCLKGWRRPLDAGRSAPLRGRGCRIESGAPRIYADPTRHSPPHPLGEEHAADHPGDEDGGGRAAATRAGAGLQRAPLRQPDADAAFESRGAHRAARASAAGRAAGGEAAAGAGHRRQGPVRRLQRQSHPRRAELLRGAPRPQGLDDRRGAEGPRFLPPASRRDDRRVRGDLQPPGVCPRAGDREADHRALLERGSRRGGFHLQRIEDHPDASA